MKTTGILLLAIGAILLVASIAFPEGAKEEGAFMQSAQQRANKLDHGDTQPANSDQAKKEIKQAQDDRKSLFLRAEHALFGGVIFAAAGTILLAVDMMRRKAES